MKSGPSSQTAAMLIALGCMLSAGGLLFSQPAPGQHSGRSAVSSPLLGTQQQASIVQADGTQSTAEEEGGFHVFRNICLGIALGLAVGLSGMSSAEAKYDPNNFDLKTATPEEWKKFKKEEFNASTSRTFTKEQDKKYARSSTGAGVYKQYKMDFASPIKTIPEDDPGYYPKVVDFNNPPAPVREYYRQIRERVKPYLRYSGKYGNSFSDKSPGGLPAPYKNRGGAAYEGIEGRANRPDGTPR
mmetsp:Transcript_103612/g.231352  ORF Transcript_103612/g.231352 Transcript_103612/m.231352 type:complete len:243 (+) Transcript_103612:67-795(+)